MTCIAFHHGILETELIVYINLPSFNQVPTLKHTVKNVFELTVTTLAGKDILGNFSHTLTAKLPGIKYNTLVVRYKGIDHQVSVRS